MKNPFSKIGILLILVIALPPLFFSAYEMGNMVQNEQMIDSIYTSQLGSVIFSVNQYSDDVVSGWANQLEQELLKNSTKEEEVANAFFKRNVSLEMVFFADSVQIIKSIVKQPPAEGFSNTEKQIQQTLETNKMVIYRLLQYLDGGYRKIQPVDLNTANKSLFLFAYQSLEGSPRICGLVVNTEGFIRENLGPKIQSVAQDKFYLSVFEQATGAEVYSNELYETNDKNIEHKSELWLLPGYQLGIQLKGETIEDLVKQRSRFNFWLIVIMDSILILAAWFVYRGVRQQLKLAQIKSEFVSNVSHEIRTPLAVINMYSETLEMGRVKSEEKKKEYYKVINTEANRLSGIVNKILNFSKIESGKREYKFEETDINEIIGQTIQTYQHHFNNKGFVCNFKPGKNLPPVKADREAVADAAINLIDNAMKYSGDKKQLDVTTGFNNQFVFVEVKDYGIGIDQKEQKLVFDKFYRITKGNLAHKAKGSGIGLSIVKHIMDAHRGEVTLISTVGKGSRFVLNFPRKTEKTI